MSSRVQPVRLERRGYPRGCSRFQHHGWLLCAFSVLCLLRIPSAYAEQHCAKPVGRFASIEGKVEVQSATGGSWRNAVLNGGLCEGDTISVGPSSRAAVQLNNSAVLRLDQNSRIRLLTISSEHKAWSGFDLIKGAFQSFSRQPWLLRVTTPALEAFIDGTEFLVEVGADQRSTLSVLEGDVRVANNADTVTVKPGSAASAMPGSPLTLTTVVRPRNAVQWSLYYPPVLATSGTPAAASPLLRELRDHIAHRDATRAFKTLERIPEAAADAHYFVHRAALLLSVGRVPEARRDIDEALRRDPNTGLAYALRSIIHVTHNETEPALAAATQADQLGGSAAAKIALSYAQQASFELNRARATLLAAVAAYPDDALAWARLGELQLMLSERHEALAAAAKAIAIDPNLARTQLVLGYAALAAFETERADAAFQRAIALDSSDPLGHLGLGLTAVATGKLEAGRKEIEVAVGLDSNSSLLRSYLGKAYFEEGRPKIDAQQFQIGKDLDRLDPTPYLYDGIRLQTENRPIEALREFEASVERNDQRAVYRGRLLLDQDRAARNVSVARVYRDLGFNELGLRKGGQSLAYAPTNASAHRLMADSYLGLRRREIARVSELLQAQLLQDINVNPVQPSIAETNLNSFTIGGPATPGFNEFTPLYQRNMAKLDVTAFGGSNTTYGGEGVVTGLYDRFSFSAGGYHYQSNGWRDNNDLTQHIVNIFAQAAVTPDLNVQAEFRRRESDQGDLAFNFNRDELDRNALSEREQDTVRFGLRYSPRPDSQLLFSYIHSEREQFNQASEREIQRVELREDVDGDQFEGQYIFQHPRFNLIAGAAYSEADLRGDSTFIFGRPELPPVSFPASQQAEHSRGYLYSNIYFPASITWTVGFSYDYYQEVLFDQSLFNPKIGLQWDITDRFRLRAAAFNVLKPVLVNNRTIEPTQIAGFNQFFDDVDATRSSRYGGGFDWRISRSLFLGGEITWRRMSEPVDRGNRGVPRIEPEDRNEDLHSLYLYWTPTDRLSLKAEFAYDRFRGNSDSGAEATTDVPAKVETFSAPLSVTYFDPTGLFASLGGTYVNQHVRYPIDLPGSMSGADDFFLVDAALGYRMPKRLGIVSVGVKNLFNTQFSYQDDNFREFRDESATGPYFPDRILLARIMLSF